MPATDRPLRIITWDKATLLRGHRWYFNIVAPQGEVIAQSMARGYKSEYERDDTVELILTRRIVHG